MKFRLRTYFPILIATLLVSCGGDEPAPQDPTAPEIVFDAVNLLPDDIAAYEVQLEGEKRAIPVGDLSNYVGELIATYQMYHAAGVATTRYSVQQTKISVEIAQFASLQDAYGFYARTRPDGIATGDVGSESYVLGNSMYFVSYLYAVTLSADDNQPRTMTLASLLAQEINSGIKRTSIPQFFGLYPMMHQVEPSKQYYPSRFLGVEGLDSVYTISYLLEGDTAVFFMTIDLGGERFLKLREYAASLGPVEPAPDSIPYYGDHAFMFDHPEHGRIVAGLVRSKLAGVMDFVPSSHQRLTMLWILGLR